MPLEIPDLDDREFADILEDARKLVPVHAGEWTDHNASDPGIAILELLSWLAETYGYQLDRVTDAHVEKYLRLLGWPPRPPSPATAALGFALPEGTEAVTIPAGESLLAETGVETLAFETTDAVTLTQAAVSQVVSEHRGGRVDNTDANATDGTHYLAFGERAERGSTLYLGFDADPFPPVGSGADPRLDLRVVFHEDDLPPPATHGDERSGFEPTVGLRWQYCTDYRAWYDEGAWRNLTVSRDETNSLYRGGTVAVDRPAGWDPASWGVDESGILDRDPGLYWLRCVVVRSGFEVAPQFDTVAVNVGSAAHRETVADRTTLVGPDGRTETSALPWQTFAFEHKPVLDAEVTVGGELWRPRPDFDASGPDDRHYVLDGPRGRIRFGDGRRGAVPEPGESVVARTYTHGGGEVGNVPASTRWRFANEDLGDVRVTQPAAATGGSDAESIEGALVRLREDLTTPYRAVTSSDYRRVATSTPGLRFGRAHASVRPDTPDETSEPEPNGSVSETCAGTRTAHVVVVPFGTRDRPTPSEGFLEAVRCHLAEHRLVTDRVTVEGPQYVGVGVNAEVRIESGYTPDRRAAAVEDALDAFLDPLSGFGGGGWPFGRPVYRSELYATIEDVEGIECVLSLSVSAPGATGVAPDGTVEVPDAALVYGRDHDVAVRTDRGDCGRS